jgi:O-antigen/teichoic acid export membrane protein
MKSKKNVSIITLLFSYANKIFLIVQGVVLVPMYLAHFPLSVYGAWLATGNIVGILGMLEGGMNMVYSQKLSFLFGQNKLHEFSLIETSGLFISLIILFLFISIGFILSPFVPAWININYIYHSDIKTAFIIASFAASFGILEQNMAAIVGSWLDAKINGISNILGTISGITAIIIGLKNNLGVISIPLGTLVDALAGVSFLGVFIYLKSKRNRFPKLHLNLQNVKGLIKDTIPLTFSNIGSSIISQSQYLIIANFINPAATAIYAITIKVFIVVSSIIAPIASSIFNSVAYFDVKKDLTKVKDVFKRTLIIQGSISIALFGVVLAFNKSFISLWVGAKDYGGDSLTILSFAALFLSYRFSFINTYFLALGFIKTNAISNLIEICIRMLFILILISYFGYLAFPIAQIISVILVLSFFYMKFIASSFLISLKETIRLYFNNLIFLIIISVLSSIILLVLPLINKWYVLIVSTVAFSLFILLLSLILSNTLRTELIKIYNSLKFKRLHAS